MGLVGCDGRERGETVTVHTQFRLGLDEGEDELVDVLVELHQRGAVGVLVDLAGTHQLSDEVDAGSSLVVSSPW